MRKTFFYVFTTLIILGLLAGCASGKGSIKSEITKQTLVSSPTATLAPPTLTPSPQPSPTSTQTMTPTLTPSATPIVYYPDGEVINVDNFDQIEKYKILSKGSIRLLTTSGDRQHYLVLTERGLFIYESDSLEEIWFYPGYNNFSILPDGTAFAAVTPGLDIEIIEFENGDIRQTIKLDNTVGIGTISFSEDGSLMGVSVTQPHEIRVDYTSDRIDVFDLQEQELIARLESDVVGSCGRIEFSDDGMHLLSFCIPAGFGSPWVIDWDVPEQSIRWTVRNEGLFPQFPFSPDGAYVITNTGSEAVIRWAANGNEVNRVPGKVSANAFSADGQYFVTSSFELVRVWHVTSSQSVAKLPSGLDWPEVSFSEDGQYILANGGEKAWRASDYELEESYPAPEPADPEMDMSKMREIGHLDSVQGVEVQSNGTLLVWGYSNNESLWWWYPDQNVYHEILIVEGNGEPALSPFHDQFAICTAEGLAIIDLSSEELEIVASCRSYFTYLAFSDDAKTIFSNAGTVINQIDLETGESLRQLRGHIYNIGKIKTSEDGELLFSVSAGPTGSGYEAAVWGLNPYTLLKKWTIPASQGLRDAMFSADGEEVIAIMDEITVWRISDGWYMANLPGSSMALSPDGKLAAVGRFMTGFAFYDTADWSLIDTEDEMPEGIPDDMPIEYYQYMLYKDTNLAKFLDKGQVMVSVNSNDVIEFWRIP